MSIVGTQLLQPEEGWRRYNDTDAYIKYTGNWTTQVHETCYELNNHHSANTPSSSIGYNKCEFYFYGTSIRLIDVVGSSKAVGDRNITIDGKIIGIAYNQSDVKYQTVIYEGIFEEGIHHVIISNAQVNSNTNYLFVDAVDINEDGFLCNKEGLLDITPIMTSNTEPSNYVVSSKNTKEGYTDWMAFSNKYGNPMYAWCTSSLPSWIAIDMGKTKEVSAFKIEAYEFGIAGNPREFYFEGSNNGIDWIKVKYVDNAPPLINGNELLYRLDENVSYKHYRINVISANNITYPEFAVIGKIKLFYKKELIKKNKLTFFKSLESEVVETVEAGVQEVHFTEKGNIYTYDNNGMIKKMGPKKFLVDIERTSGGLNIIYNDGTNKEIII